MQPLASTASQRTSTSTARGEIQSSETHWNYQTANLKMPGMHDFAKINQTIKRFSLTPATGRLYHPGITRYVVTKRRAR